MTKPGPSAYGFTVGVLVGLAIASAIEGYWLNVAIELALTLPYLPTVGGFWFADEVERRAA